MTTDRTQHVLDAIDGALDDWSVSGDAMRWSPEPDPMPVPLPGFRCDVRPVFTDHDWREHDRLNAWLYTLTLLAPYRRLDPAVIVTTVQ